MGSRRKRLAAERTARPTLGHDSGDLFLECRELFAARAHEDTAQPQGSGEIGGFKRESRTACVVPHRERADSDFQLADKTGGCVSTRAYVIVVGGTREKVFERRSKHGELLLFQPE